MSFTCSRFQTVSSGNSAFANLVCAGADRLTTHKKDANRSFLICNNSSSNKDLYKDRFFWANSDMTSQSRKQMLFQLVSETKVLAPASKIKKKALQKRCKIVSEVTKGTVPFGT